MAQGMAQYPKQSCNSVTVFFRSDRRADVRNAGLQHIQEMMPMIG
uniref:Uncharacterized protein n=1 Tax=Anopheles albimanus TaxID=7167 RepID=A0A8W7K7H6_ANOAL